MIYYVLQELDTARREGINVIVCVAGEPFDWSKVAEGFGLAGSEATGAAELMVALDDATRAATATVIDMTRFE